MSSINTQNIIPLNIPGLSPGLKIRVHESGDQMISTKLRKEHCWEAYETSLTIEHLSPGDVYIDVGANIGYYSLIAAQRVGEEGKVISYEPDKNNYRQLEFNISLNNLKNVKTFPYGLYDKQEQGHLYLSENNFGDHRIYAAGESRAHEEITLINGGQHLSQFTDKIDFLKIDTQGAEYFVVKGLHKIIMKNCQHLRMLLEFCPYGIRQSGADGHDLLQLLDKTGMQYHIVDHQQECLIPAQSHHLAQWITDMANKPNNEGFINLFVTPSGYNIE